MFVDCIINSKLFIIMDINIKAAVGIIQFLFNNRIPLSCYIEKNSSSNSFMNYTFFINVILMFVNRWFKC